MFSACQNELKGIGQFVFFASPLWFQIKRLKNHFAIYWKNNFRFRRKNKTQQRQNSENNVSNWHKRQRQTNKLVNIVRFSLQLHRICWLYSVQYIEISIFLYFTKKGICCFDFGSFLFKNFIGGVGKGIPFNKFNWQQIYVFSFRIHLWKKKTNLFLNASMTTKEKLRTKSVFGQCGFSIKKTRIPSRRCVYSNYNRTFSTSSNATRDKTSHSTANSQQAKLLNTKS